MIPVCVYCDITSDVFERYRAWLGSSFRSHLLPRPVSLLQQGIRTLNITFVNFATILTRGIVILILNKLFNHLKNIFPHNLYINIKLVKFCKSKSFVTERTDCIIIVLYFWIVLMLKSYYRFLVKCFSWDITSSWKLEVNRNDSLLLLRCQLIVLGKFGFARQVKSPGRKCRVQFSSYQINITYNVQ